MCRSVAWQEVQEMCDQHSSQASREAHRQLTVTQCDACQGEGPQSRNLTLITDTCHGLSLEPGAWWALSRHDIC